ncbi:MAG: hypothetical protein JSR89_15505 [Proteobacteria bacterium]|nr:hypothetical protein [Pseudomonadota bacterium]
MAKKLDILNELDFGSQVAEEEKDTLREYFVETNPWKKVLKGQVDIVYGPKGAGKSAIYVLIQAHEAELSRKGILLLPAENVRGDPAFKDLVVTPPTSEREFEYLWKLYFLSLIGLAFVQHKVTNSHALQFNKVLADAGLLPTEGMTFSGILKRVQEYIGRYTKPHALEGTMSVDQVSGLPTSFSGKVVFDEPDSEGRSRGEISVSELFKLANEALKVKKQKIWLLLDRLDVAFDDSAELEKNALRALFRAYRTIRSYDNIVLKIFLRTDIWDRISEKGFREATHLARELTLSWDAPTLQHLLIRRLLNNPLLLKQYGLNKRQVLQSVTEQQKLFDRVFPDQVEVGKRQSTTMDWMIKRTTDGTNLSGPRELILFLKELRDEQIKRLERGEPEPAAEALFDRASFKQALPKVSEYRTTKVLYAEFPELRNFIEALRSKRSEHDIKSLAEIWQRSASEAKETAERLVSVGFFERRKASDTTTYWVPFIYRPYLNLIQGRAE